MVSREENNYTLIRDSIINKFNLNVPSEDNIKNNIENRVINKLDSFENVVPDGGIKKKILRKGYSNRPLKLQTVEYKMKIKDYNGKVVFNSFESDDTHEVQLDSEELMLGITYALYSMLKREKSIFIIQSKYISESKLPEDYFLEIIIELIDCKFNNDNIEFMTTESRVDNAKLLLSTSNDLLIKKEFDQVDCLLKQGLIFLDMNLSNNNISPLKHSYYYILTENNYQLKNWEKTIYYSNLYLYTEINSTILFWKSMALINISDFEKARDNLKKILKIKPNNVPALNELNKLNDYKKIQKKKETNLYKKMLNI